MACIDRTGVRPTFRLIAAGGYRAVLKDAAGKAVWECEHVHKNRDTSGRMNGPSACACAVAEVSRRFPEAVREMNSQGGWY